MLSRLNRFLCVLATVVALAGFSSASAVAAGELDPSFGGSGQITRDVVPGQVPTDSDVAVSQLLSSGELVVAGEQDGRIFVARFTAAGALDPTFGNVRVIDANPGTSPQEVNGISVDSAGRVVVGGRVDNSGFVLRLTSSGALDTTFGSGGRIIFTDPGGVQITDVETTSGDSVYALASGYPSRVFKYDSTGSPDSSFGINGTATAANNMNDTKMALDLGGRVIVAGSDTGSSVNSRVYRLQGPSDSSPGFYDTTFDTDGVAEITGGTGEFVDVEITTSNRPLLLGKSGSDGFKLTMVTFAGAVDTGFDGDGYLTINPLVGSNEVPFDLAVDSGFAYIGGSSSSGPSNVGFVTAITSTGAFDSLFGGIDGTIEPGCDAPVTICPIRTVATTSTHFAFAAAEEAISGVKRIYVGSVAWNGFLRNVFDGDGRANHQEQRPWDSYVADSAMAADGSIYSVGEYGAYGDYETFIHKQTASGGTDGFGTGGTITYDFLASYNDNITGIAVAPDGAVYVTGTFISPGTIFSYVAKFNSAGLDSGSGFGVGGIVTILVGPGDYYSGAITVDSAGRLLLAGTEINPPIRRGWITRLNATTGAFDASYNAGNPLEIDYTDDTNEGFSDVGELPDGSVFASGYANGRVALMRTSSTGTGVAGFGTNGKVESTALGNISPGSRVSFVQSGGSIFIGTTVSDPSGESIRIARLAADGSVDSSFGSAGGTVIDTGATNTDVLYDLAVDSSGRLVAFGSHRGSGQRDSLTARVNSSGTIDTNFGSNGIALVDHSADSRPDYLTSGFIRGGKPVAVGNAQLGSGVNALLTVQRSLDPTTTTTTPVAPPPPDRCTPAKRKLRSLTNKLKRQKKSLKRARTAAKKSKIKKQIRKTNKQIRSARRAVRLACGT